MALFRYNIGNTTRCFTRLGIDQQSLPHFSSFLLFPAPPPLPVPLPLPPRLFLLLLLRCYFTTSVADMMLFLLLVHVPCVFFSEAAGRDGYVTTTTTTATMKRATSHIFFYSSLSALFLRQKYLQESLSMIHVEHSGSRPSDQAIVHYLMKSENPRFLPPDQSVPEEEPAAQVAPQEGAEVASSSSESES